MTNMTRIRVGTYNLHDGGMDDGTDARLKRQLAMLAEQRLDLLGIQEAKYWNRDHARLRYGPEHALGMRSVLVKSHHHGCHLVICIRPPRLRIVEARHERGRPYWHAVACLRLRLQLDENGDECEFDFVNTHLAPSSPENRQAEAESLRLLVKGERALIAVGDFNAAALDDPALQAKTQDPLALRKLETGPAQALADAGLTDVGRHLHDLKATVGHRHGLAYRCDRVYTTRPSWARAHEVIVTPDSDHALVVAVFEVPRGN